MIKIDSTMLQLVIIIGLCALGTVTALSGDLTIAHDVALGLVGALAINKSTSPQSQGTN